MDAPNVSFGKCIREQILDLFLSEQNKKFLKSFLPCRFHNYVDFADRWDGLVIFLDQLYLRQTTSIHEELEQLNHQFINHYEGVIHSGSQDYAHIPYHQRDIEQTLRKFKNTTNEQQTLSYGNHIKQLDGLVRMSRRRIPPDQRVSRNYERGRDIVDESMHYATQYENNRFRKHPNDKFLYNREKVQYLKDQSIYDPVPQYKQPNSNFCLGKFDKMPYSTYSGRYDANKYPSFSIYNDESKYEEAWRYHMDTRLLN